MPIPIGFTLHEQIQPNLPQQMGRIIIQHKPKMKPMNPGHFQIVIGSASFTEYSIEVSTKIAKMALPVVDHEIIHAKQCQARLPIVLVELDMISESIRLTERKLLVCEKMIVEAEIESTNLHQTMKLLQEKLEKDDEDMLLLEDERRLIQRELSIVEIEYSKFCNMFSSRCQEKVDIKEGIQMMYRFQNDRTQEKTTLIKLLENYRRDLPACIRLIRSLTEALQVAMSLNTVYQGAGMNQSDESFLPPNDANNNNNNNDDDDDDQTQITEEENRTKSYLESVYEKNHGNSGQIQISTPANEIRRFVKQFGFFKLSSIVCIHINDPILYSGFNCY
jgi:hypothetical protein